MLVALGLYLMGITRGAGLYGNRFRTEIMAVYTAADTAFSAGAYRGAGFPARAAVGLAAVWLGL